MCQRTENDIMLDMMILKSKLNRYSPILEQEYYNKLYSELQLELAELQAENNL